MEMIAAVDGSTESRRDSTHAQWLREKGAAHSTTLINIRVRLRPSLTSHNFERPQWNCVIYLPIPAHDHFYEFFAHFTDETLNYVMT